MNEHELLYKRSIYIIKYCKLLKFKINLKNNTFVKYYRYRQFTDNTNLKANELHSFYLVGSHSIPKII